MLLGHKMKFMMIILKVFVIVISFISVYEMEAFQLLEILRCKVRIFSNSCLFRNVLKAVLSALNNLRGDSINDVRSYAYRYAGYKQYTWWVQNNLEKRVCKVIPSCAAWAVRTSYLSNNDKHTPFIESKEQEK